MPNRILDLVAHVLSRRHAEHLVQFLESESLGFGNEKQDQEPENHTPGGVPPKGTLNGECALELVPGEGDDEVEAPGGRRGPRHADITNMHGKSLRRVRERHRAFAGRVKYLKEIHTRGDHGHTGRGLGDEEGHAGPEKGDGQEGEGEEEQIPAAPFVNGEEGRDGEEEVEDSRAHGHKEGGVDVEATIEEDVGAVVGDDVDLFISVSPLTWCAY